MSLDLEARASGTISMAGNEGSATSTAPRSTTPDHAPHADELRVDLSVFYKYAAPSNMWDWRQMAAVLLGDLSGKELLDYGCGMGEEAVYFAKLGARVTAVDTSEIGVSILKKRARLHELDIRAFEMRCDRPNLPAASFDRIHGMGILHRVGTDAGLAEVWRLLRPGGMGVFLEPIGGRPNPTWRELVASTRRFWRVAAYPYHLLYRLKRFIPASMYDAVRRFDHGVLSMAPSLHRYAGAVVLQVVK
jgi:SAM-dependent methyltransferase